MYCFLDRDGIINVDCKYVGTKERFIWYEDIFEIVKALKDFGYKIIIITNQSGIARNYYSLNDFVNLSFYMIDEFGKRGIDIEIRFCPHLPYDNCKCRKPKPNMILCYKISGKDIFIGDNKSDMIAANLSNIRHRWLVSSSPEGPYSDCFRNHKELKNFINKFLKKNN